MATLEFSSTDLAGMRLVSSWPVMDLLDKVGAGRGLEKPTKKAVAAASAVGLLTYPRRTPGDWFMGGRAMQRVWLRATKLNLAFQPMTALTYIFERLRSGGEGMSRREQSDFESLRKRFLLSFEVENEEAELMLFRLARTAPPGARSLWRQVDDVPSFDPRSADQPD